MLSISVCKLSRELCRFTRPVYGQSMADKGTSCTEGFGPDPGSAPGVIGTYKDQFACMHHALLAHAAAVDEFRRGGYKGKIGIKVDGGVSLPLNPASPADQAAAARAMDFVGLPPRARVPMQSLKTKTYFHRKSGGM